MITEFVRISFLGLSNLRFAAGACVVAAGLLVGVAGGATAAADTGSDGVTASVDDTSGAPRPAGVVTDTVRKALSDLTSTLGSGRKSGLPAIAVPTLPTSIKDPSATTRPQRDLDDALASLPSLDELAADATASARSAVAPVGVAPLPVAAVPTADVVSSISDLAVAVSETITAGQEMLLTSATDGVAALTQLQTDISSLFGAAGLSPVTTPPPGLRPGSAAADVARPVPSQPPTPQAPAPMPAVSLFGNAAAVTEHGAAAPVAADRNVSLAVTASPAPTPAGQMSGPMKFVRTIGDALKSLSLWELAALALPGLCGLAMLTGAGGWVGRRQAKAGFAVQVGDVARFTRPGPLGVVRSGSSANSRGRAPCAERFLKRSVPVPLNAAPDTGRLGGREAPLSA